MEALIKVTTSEQGLRVVSARDLHEFLEIKSKFIDWIKNRITKYDFIENQDFVTVSKNLENGGREFDYALTLEMAKELAMVEGNDKGKTARQYFIECERLAKEALSTKVYSYAIADPIERARVWIEEQKEKQRLLEETNKLKPKAEYVDVVLQSDAELTTTSVAKELGMSAVVLNRKLCEAKIQFWHDGHYTLYQKYASGGYAKVRTHQYFDRKGQCHTNHYLVWTEAGRMFIHSKLNLDMVASFAELELA